MKKVITLNENDLKNLIKRILEKSGNDHLYGNFIVEQDPGTQTTQPAQSTPPAQLTPQQQIIDTFKKTYNAVDASQINAANSVNYNKINLKEYSNTFTTDYIMYIPKQNLRQMMKDFKKGNSLLSVDNESSMGCSRLLKTYKELYYKYKNTEYTTEASLSNFKPKLEYCYRKFRSTKLGGEIYPFTNSNDKNLGVFLLRP